MLLLPSGSCRPALRGYALFWFVFRLLEVLSALLRVQQDRSFLVEAGYCLYMADVGLLFGVCAPGGGTKDKSTLPACAPPPKLSKFRADECHTAPH